MRASYLNEYAQLIYSEINHIDSLLQIACLICYSANKMVAIGTSIAVITVAIGTACFVVFWCNPDTLPCLKKCP